jgi:hypothetical protein
MRGAEVKGKEVNRVSGFLFMPGLLAIFFNKVEAGIDNET